MKNRPLMLDLYCGAGGTSMGYYRAGFDVLGVDRYQMPNYPFDLIQARGLEVLQSVIDGKLKPDAIHASPPCQRYSTLSKRFLSDRIDTYPEYIEPLREMMITLNIPCVIENVMGAPLINPTILCGSHFNLTAQWPEFGKVGLRRHRGFEPHGFELPDPGKHDHSYRAVPVYGHTNTNGSGKPFKGKGFDGESFSDLRKKVMGIDWMTHEELNEAVPPAYAEYVGSFMMAAVRSNQEDGRAA